MEVPEGRIEKALIMSVLSIINASDCVAYRNAPKALLKYLR